MSYTESDGLFRKGGGLVRLSLFIEKFLHTPLTESSYKEEQFSLSLDTFIKQAQIKDFSIKITFSVR